MEKFHENCNFLANGCSVEQNSRKETPLKIKLYYKDFSNLPINTFSKAWKLSSLIIVLAAALAAGASGFLLTL